MAKIAFIGTGSVANALARPLAKAGHEIVLGSRDPAAKTDSPYPVVGHVEAVAAADVVVNAVPGASSLAVFGVIGDDALAGKVLLDAGNAWDMKGALIYPNSSLGEKMQELLPSAKVVKTANTAFIDFIAEPAQLANKGSLFLSGEDDDAKAVVRGLLADIGWEGSSVLDLGGIASARGPEHYFVLMLGLITSAKNPLINIAVVS